MSNYNPYLVDEIVAGKPLENDYFGLIRDDNDEMMELYGFDITLDGRIVVPSLNPTVSPDQIEVETC